MKIPRSVRPLLRRIVPDAIRTMRGDRWRRDLDVATDKVRRLSQGRVLSGPFAGMQYVDAAGFSMLGPKLLGTYEQELTEVLPDLVLGPSSHLVNVGAAEGYYAVGLLMLDETLRVTAFERSRRSRELLGTLAELNGVRDRVDIRGNCGIEELRAVLRDTGARSVLMDIEGGERTLLGSSGIPELVDSSILVETHEFEEPGETAEIVERFRSTHRIVRISARERSARDLPQVPGLTSRERVLAAFERSAEHQEWLWMVPAHDNVSSNSPAM